MPSNLLVHSGLGGTVENQTSRLSKAAGRGEGLAPWFHRLSRAVGPGKPLSMLSPLFLPRTQQADASESFTQASVWEAGGR